MSLKPENRAIHAATNLIHRLSVVGVVLFGFLSLATFVEFDNTLLLGVVPLAPWLFLASALVFALLKNRVLVLAIGIAASGVIALSSPGSALPGANCSVVEGASGTSTVVYSHNVLFGRADADEVASQIADVAADIVLLQEAVPSFMERITPLLEDYPHVMADGYQAVFSRFEISDTDRAFDDRNVLGLLDTRIETSEGPLRVINVHATPPHIPGGRDEQVEQFASLRAAFAIDDAELPVLAMGDFNATPFDSRYRSLAADGVVDAHDAVGCGIGVSWSPLQGFGPALLGLDHALSSGAEAEVFEILDYAGSDHKGIAVAISFS